MIFNWLNALGVGGGGGGGGVKLSPSPHPPAEPYVHLLLTLTVNSSIAMYELCILIPQEAGSKFMNKYDSIPDDR